MPSYRPIIEGVLNRCRAREEAEKKGAKERMRNDSWARDIAIYSRIGAPPFRPADGAGAGGGGRRLNDNFSLGPDGSTWRSMNP